MGSPAINAIANSLLPFVPGGGGTVPTGFLNLFYGTFTANSTSAVTVADTGVTASSVIIFTAQTVAGTPAASPYVATITPGTGFTVKAGSGDTSVYGYLRIG